MSDESVVASDVNLVRVAINEGRWHAAALYFYRFWYVMFDRSEDEIAFLREMRKLIKEACPDTFKTGVHLLAYGAAYCGEDVYIADGNVTHSLWRQHRICEQYTVVWRGKGLWCAHCNTYISRTDFVTLGKARHTSP